MSIMRMSHNDINTTYEDFTIWVKVSPFETEARLGVTGGVVLREEFAISFIVRWDDRLKGLDQIVDRGRELTTCPVLNHLCPDRWMQIHCVASKLRIYMFWNKKKVVEEPIETRSFTSQVSGNIENEAVGNTAGARLSQAAIREICSRYIWTCLRQCRRVTSRASTRIDTRSFRGNRKIIHHVRGICL